MAADHGASGCPLGWPLGPSAPSLGPDEVHVWLVALATSAACRAGLEGLLDADERARATRLRLPHARERFVVAHGALRDVLARYVGARAASLRFALGAMGKPTLARPPATGISFNLAHSGDVAMLAVSRRAAVGIDVEELRDATPVEAIATRFFSPAEIEGLNALPAAERQARFFTLWAAKEAYVKALGDSVWQRLPSVRVLLPPEAAVPTLVDGKRSVATEWTLTLVDPGVSAAAALVVVGPSCTLACWRWEPAAIPSR